MLTGWYYYDRTTACLRREEGGAGTVLGEISKAAPRMANPSDSEM